ncbi:MAG: DUF21 domain-containing protein [Planctomycetaceae bacterium]
MTQSPSVVLFAAAIIFLIGIRLSAFFSGSETGFYRLSTLQLMLQVQRGDRVARRLQMFVTHPERFVATTLVGNNVANYLTTVAIGMVVTVIVVSSSGAAEVLATVLLTPVIFIFGELIPKSLYYRAPMSLLRSGSRFFTFCFWVFLPISYPLILVSRAVSRFGDQDNRPLDIVLGRTRLSSLLAAGHHEGILTRLQNQLAENMMRIATAPVELAIMPPSQVVGVPESISRDELLALARRTKSAFVMLHPDGRPGHWTHSVRIADVIGLAQAPRLAMKQLPAFRRDTPRLEVMTELFQDFASWGVVVEGEPGNSNARVIGVISRQSLASQLFRVVQASPAEFSLVPPT